MSHRQTNKQTDRQTNILILLIYMTRAYGPSHPWDECYSFYFDNSYLLNYLFTYLVLTDLLTYLLNHLLNYFCGQKYIILSSSLIIHYLINYS